MHILTISEQHVFFVSTCIMSTPAKANTTPTPVCHAYFDNHQIDSTFRHSRSTGRLVTVRGMVMEFESGRETDRNAVSRTVLVSAFIHPALIHIPGYPLLHSQRACRSNAQLRLPTRLSDRLARSAGVLCCTCKRSSRSITHLGSGSNTAWTMS